MSEQKRLATWQKFPVDREVVDRVRSMLSLADDEELPEALWICMGIRKALEHRFMDVGWSYDSIFVLIMASENYRVHNRTQYVPGQLVFIHSLNKEGHYWHPAPFGRHLINSYGDVYIVSTDDIKAPQTAIVGSPENNAIKLAEVLQAADPVEKDPGMAYFDKLEQAALAASGV